MKTTRTPSYEEDQQLQIAKDHIEAGYKLVWEEEDPTQAIGVLNAALEIQQTILGKHHLQVGYTCNYIGTAYWVQNESLGDALKYFLEARRIYCKSGQGRVKGVDQRIQSILKQMGLASIEIEECQTAILRAIDHELQADYFKGKGLHDQAKKETIKAKRYSATLKNLVAF